MLRITIATASTVNQPEALPALLSAFSTSLSNCSIDSA
jgi:hypothetical protein